MKPSAVPGGVLFDLLQFSSLDPTTFAASAGANEEPIIDVRASVQVKNERKHAQAEEIVTELRAQSLSQIAS